MPSRLMSAAVVGIEAIPVQVEVDINRGLPGYFVVGLPDESVRESRERVRSAVLNSGLDYPVRRVTVNLAPADLRKEGSSFDLPIALGILAAQGAVPAHEIGRYLIAGELSLTGEIRPVRGVLPMAAAAADHKCAGIVLPRRHAREASVVRGLNVVPVTSLDEAVRFFRGVFIPEVESCAAPETESGESKPMPDFSEVKGQEHVKRALEVAAAGAHNVLMIGSPGSGKTMMARRLPGILPPLAFEEALEVTRVHSVAGLVPAEAGLIAAPPFRSPHHTVSYAGLIGGGSFPRPGEASLASHGVLFLDELAEFSRRSLEALREPLEEGKVTIARAAATVTYPARFMLVAAMNPCPCGHLGNPSRPCLCNSLAVRRYLSRISGPLMDRIDIHVEVPPVDFADLTAAADGESSAAVRERVLAARQRQSARHRGRGFLWNGQMTAEAVRDGCRLNNESLRLLAAAMKKLGLSARAYGKVVRLARTIADLDGAGEIAVPHVAEAIGYRSLDRNN